MAKDTATPNWQDLQAQLRELEKMRSEFESKIAQVDEQVELLRQSIEPKGSANRAYKGTSPRKRLWAQPARLMVLEALKEIDHSAYTREIARLIEARSGRKILPTRFGTLAADEVNAFRSKGPDARQTWICFAVTADRHEPIKRLLARSDWPLERRVHALTTGRLQYLWMTRRFCELAMKADESATDPQMLRFLAADYARDLPGITVRRGVFDLERWRDVAIEQITGLEPRDEEIRKESAERLARRSETFQLFGVPEIIDGDRDVVVATRGRA